MNWLTYQLMSDMAYTSSPCPLDQFACFNNMECALTKHVCDSMYHCSDGSDEKFCAGKEASTTSKPEVGDQSSSKPEIVDQSSNKPEVNQTGSGGGKVDFDDFDIPPSIGVRRDTFVCHLCS